MRELNNVVDLLRAGPLPLNELASKLSVNPEKCLEYVTTLKELGLVYETQLKGQRLVHLRQFPTGPKITLLSRFRAPDDISAVDIPPPKPSEIRDLTRISAKM